VVALVVQRLEVFCVVCQEDNVLFTTPRYQFGITRVLSEPVLCLFDILFTFSEQSFEDPTNVLVKQDLSTCHFTVSLGFSDDSRTRSNVASFSTSSLRISSI